MKIFLKYLMLPLITACIVTTSIFVFYHLDASKGANVAVSQRIATRRSLPQAGLKPAPTKPAAASEAHTPKGTAPGTRSDASRPEGRSHRDFVYPTDNTRDPFQQVSTSADTQQLPSSDQPSIMLTGIIWDEEDPVAIIADSADNSYLVRTGEEISGARIIAIQPRSITIERDGKMQELVLWPAKL